MLTYWISFLWCYKLNLNRHTYILTQSVLFDVLSDHSLVLIIALFLIYSSTSLISLRLKYMGIKLPFLTIYRLLITQA